MYEYKRSECVFYGRILWQKFNSETPFLNDSHRGEMVIFGYFGEFLISMNFDFAYSKYLDFENGNLR